MKAAQITNYGHADAIQIVTIDKPTVAPDGVLVEVHAASINPFDTMVREGMVKDMMPPLPVTLGGDIAGTIIGLGPDAQGLAVGDEVFGTAQAIAGNSGAFAEYAATKPATLAKKPTNTDFLQAAALPLVGVSALQALTEHINLQSAQKIFIHGGAGGIGTVAIQIAKHIGAYVATTATGEGIDYVKSLGADEVIDYKAQDFSQVLKDFDAVFDTVGHDDFVKSYSILKSGGVAVSMIAPVDEAKANECQIQAFTQSTKVTSERLNQLRELVEAGHVTPHVDKVFSLDQTKEAFEAREGGKVTGKVVLQVK